MLLGSMDHIIQPFLLLSFLQLELLLAKPDSRQFPLVLGRKLLLVVDEYPREVEFFYL